MIALFLTFCFGNVPTSLASDRVNECHKHTKVYMTDKQWDNRGRTKITPEALKETAPSAPESAAASSFAFLNKGIKRVHVRARSMSGSSAVGVRLIFFLLSP